jgi:starch-binding outer membrane protein, SusD/RagB family
MNTANGTERGWRSPARRLGRAVLPAAAVGILATGCDLEVFSPATVDEEGLTEDRTIEALWSGIMGQVSHLGPGQAGTGGFFTFGALRTDELVHSGHPDGSTDNFGPLPHLRAFSDGDPIQSDWEAVEELWNQSMMTRYVIDFGLEKAEEVYNLHSQSDRVEVRNRVTRDRTRLYAWAGIGYRLLGDNLCHAVIDESPLQDHTVFYERGLAALDEGVAFAEAADVADVDEFGLTAVFAARATVRLMLGDFDGAEADAGRVLTGFNGLQTEHTDTEPGFRQRLYLRWLDYLEDRHLTLWGTPFLEWGYNTSQNVGEDMRVTYSQHRTNANPHREWGTDLRRPWRRQTKELSIFGSLRLAKGREMRLIEAEARLRRGDWQGAVEKINELREWWNAPTGGRFERDGHPLPMVEASSHEEAWELLVRERGIELWLEGRRLPDVRRWMNDPAVPPIPTTVVRETTSGDAENDPRRPVTDIAGDFCIPVGATEIRLNPNL